MSGMSDVSDLPHTKGPPSEGPDRNLDSTHADKYADVFSNKDRLW